jgi:hypothetical protein
MLILSSGAGFRIQNLAVRSASTGVACIQGPAQKPFQRACPNPVKSRESFSIFGR